MNLKEVASVLLFVFLMSSCSSNKKDTHKEEPHYEKLDSTTLQANPIAVPPQSDSIKIKSSFDLMLAKVEDSLIAWGFTKRTEKLFKTKADYENHWLLKYYFDRHKIARTKRLNPRFFIPAATDWGHLKSINQQTFAYGNGYAIEEWTFDNETAAKKWERIVFNAQYIDNYKPFRTFWSENNKLYVLVIMGSNYHHTDIVELMRGHTAKFFNVMTNPFDLPGFKKQAGGANSGNDKVEPYYYKPDTIGRNYHYFWFYKLRHKFKDNELAVNGIHLYTYIYGSKVGEYAKVDEELIAVKAKVNFYGLGELNIVGRSKKEVEEGFGKAQLIYNGFDVYFYNKTYLLLNYENGKVSWFRYIKTNLTLDMIDQLPQELFSY